MKLILPFSLLVFFSFSLFAQDFKNLDFLELDSSSATGFKYWSTNEASNVKAVSIDEKQSAVILLSGDYNQMTPGFFYQHIPFQVDSFTQYRISANIKCENVKNGTAGIYAYSKKGDQFVSYENLLTLSGTQDWKTVHLQLWINEKADHFRIGGQSRGSGKIWFDQFKVEAIPFVEEPLSVEVQNYLDTFFNIVNTHSLYRDSIDISAIQTTTQKIASGAKNPADSYPAIRYLLGELDHHSFLQEAQQVEAWQNTSTNNNGGMEFKMATGRLLENEYAYINMPHCGSGDEVSLVQFADSLQNLIELLDHPKVKGWVLDLRENDGGNCWPMLTGIGPVLGNGICGHFIYADEAISWFYKDGSSGMGDYPRLSVSRPAYELIQKNPKVAVLTSKETGSSGEVVAAAFMNRPNTRLIGQATAGYCTANSNFLLPDGAMVFLATSVYADRNQNIIHPNIIPDITVDQEEGKDAELEKALEWLKGK